MALLRQDPATLSCNNSVSLLDVVVAHQQALLASDFGQHLTPEAASMLAAAQKVLVQSLVPFEIARRGFAEANLALRAANETLEQRVREQTVELSETVQRLELLSAELNQANRHKSDFLARMSHELRTPLNAIIGFSEVLMDRGPEEVSGERRKVFLNHIHRSGKHLLELIGDILDLAKVEAGQMELQLALFSVGDLIDSCAAVVRVLADEKGITINTIIEPAESTMVADPARMKQIVYNLLSNAVKFTPHDGNVSITAHVTDAETLVEVRDTGIGISAEDQLVIFDEFRQASRTPNQEGTGLGLAVVRKLLELHGGRIWVTSTLGQGSCFAFSVPSYDYSRGMMTVKQLP